MADEKKLLLTAAPYLGSAYLLIGALFLAFHNHNITGLSVFEGAGASANFALGAVFVVCGASALYLMHIRKQMNMSNQEIHEKTTTLQSSHSIAHTL